jgi:aminocarboxymuconate-semialdehyde decarboxylase
MIIDRRQFVRAAGAASGGFLFCRCQFAADAAAPPLQTAAGRREVVIAGTRLRTIDMHSHVFIGEVLPLLKDRKEADAGLANLARSPMAVDAATIARRLAEMDRQGIDLHVLSVHPGQFFYWADPDLSARIIKTQNDKIAEICAARPDRFVGLGAVSIQHPNQVAAEMDYAVGKLGLRGFILGGNINGDELADPKFDPFWKKAEALGIVVFIHPSVSDLGGKRFAGAGALANTIGFPLDTTIALAHMIFEGFLDRFAGVRILAAHGGGFLPSYIGRFENCHDLQAACQRMKKAPIDYLKGPQLSFDSLVYRPQNVRHLVDIAGAGQIVVGTDFGFDIASRTPVDTVLQTPGLSPADQMAILGGNAARLLKLAA